MSQMNIDNLTETRLKCDADNCQARFLRFVRNDLVETRRSAAKTGWWSQGEKDFCPKHPQPPEIPRG